MYDQKESAKEKTKENNPMTVEKQLVLVLELYVVRLDNGEKS